MTFILRNLRRDPALRLTESGRALLRWLDSRTIDPEESAGMGGCRAAQTIQMVAQLARRAAGHWQVLAAELDRRGQEMSR